MTIEKQCTEPEVGVKFAYDNSVECVGVNCVQVMGIAALARARIHSTSTSTSEKRYIEQQSEQTTHIQDPGRVANTRPVL